MYCIQNEASFFVLLLTVFTVFMKSCLTFGPFADYSLYCNVGILVMSNEQCRVVHTSQRLRLDYVEVFASLIFETYTARPCKYRPAQNLVDRLDSCRL